MRATWSRRQVLPVDSSRGYAGWLKFGALTLFGMCLATAAGGSTRDVIVQEQSGPWRLEAGTPSSNAVKDPSFGAVDSTRDTGTVIAVQTLPDLIVENVSIDPPEPTTEDIKTLTAVVKNVGPTLAGPSSLELGVSNESQGPLYSIPALRPGETSVVMRQLGPGPAQTVTVSAIADVNNDVEEINEANNLTEFRFTVVEGPGREPGFLRFSVEDYTVDEDARIVQVQVWRYGGSEGNVSVNLATGPGSATPGSDYSRVSTTLTWENGDTTSKPVSITIINDSLEEGDETFLVRLSNPTGGAILGVPASATVTIRDDDDDEAGLLQFSASVYNVNEDAGTVELSVMRVGGSAGPATVEVVTTAGTATEDEDYAFTTDTLSWDDGETSPQPFVVTIFDDSQPEGLENFGAQLNNPQGGVQLGSPREATVEIQDDDDAGLLQFSASVYNVNEDAGTVELSVMRVGGSAGTVEVDVVTTAGTATENEDYAFTEATLVWEDGETSPQPFVVMIFDDSLSEGLETFGAQLSNPQGGVQLGSPSETTVEIEDFEAGLLQFSASVYNVNEDAGTVELSVMRVGGSAGPASVDVVTINGTATEGQDYVFTEANLVWEDGETSPQPFIVTIFDDSLSEGLETFGAQLSNPQGGVQLGSPSEATVDIEDIEVEEPQPMPDEVEVACGEAVTIRVLENDIGEGLFVFGVEDPENGTAVINDDNTITYTPDEGFCGTDEFEYTVEDQAGQQESALITVTAATKARDDFEGTRAGDPETFDVLANDSGTRPFTITDVGMPAHGTAAPTEDKKKVTYTPHEGFTGEDSFSYEMTDNDGDGVSSSATVFVTVGLSSIDDLTYNQQQVAGALDDVCNRATGALGERCVGLQEELTDNEAKQALDEIAPQKVAAQGANLVEVTATQLRNITTRLSMLRRGGAAAGLGNLSVSFKGQSLPVGSIVDYLMHAPHANAMEDDAVVEQERVGSLLKEGRLGLFINGRADFGEKSTTQNETGFDFNSRGLTVGVDYRFTPTVVFGGALGYGRNHSDFAGSGGELDADLWELSAYGSHYPNNKSYLDWIVSYGTHRFDITRNIVYEGVDTTTEGTTDGEQQAISVSGGWDYNKKGWSLNPYLRVEYIRADIDGYNETGGEGLALIIADQEVESLTTAVAGRFAKVISARWGVLTPGLRIEWEHEFLDDGRLITSQFVADPSAVFSIRTDAPDRNFFNLGLNLAAAFKRGKAVYIDYERIVGLESVTANRLNLGFRMEF